MPASIHSNPSWFLIRKYCPFLQAPVDVGIHTENTSPSQSSAPTPTPVTDISRSSSTLAPAATRCLSPRWHSIIFISWDEHGSLHFHLLARCLTLICFTILEFLDKSHLAMMYYPFNSQFLQSANTFWKYTQGYSCSVFGFYIRLYKICIRLAS